MSRSDAMFGRFDGVETGSLEDAGRRGEDPRLSDQRRPATIVTGFLGSGKTTLLNQLLAAPHGLRLAVIVNELGAVGIDGKVIRGGAEFVELDNGCLCCALNADLERVLGDLAARGGFDRLLIETTGLADPLPIGWIFSRPQLSAAYRLDAILTVVDAHNIAPTLGRAPEARLQIQRADILIVNKLDLVADGGAAARCCVRALNDVAPLVETRQGAVPWEAVLGTASGTESKRGDGGAADERQGAPGPAAHEATAHEAADPEAAATGAPPPPHRPSMAAWTYALPRPVTDSELEDFLWQVPPEVFRIKGLVRGTGEFAWIHVNVVGGRIDLHPLDAAANDASQARAPLRSCLVFISDRLDVEALRRLCHQHFGAVGD